MPTTTTTIHNTVNGLWHDAQMLREHVLKRVEDRPHLYNNLVVIIQELEQNATILRPVDPPKDMMKAISGNNKSTTGTWTWFRSLKKTSIAPVAPSPTSSSSTTPPPTLQDQQQPQEQESSSSSPKLICKKAGRPTSVGRYQDLVAVDQILMEQSVLDYYPQLEAKLILLRRRLQTEAVTLERCQSNWDAAMRAGLATATATYPGKALLSLELV